jgi:hypothetical protein
MRGSSTPTDFFSYVSSYDLAPKCRKLFIGSPFSTYTRGQTGYQLPDWKVTVEDILGSKPHPYQNAGVNRNECDIPFEDREQTLHGKGRMNEKQYTPHSRQSLAMHTENSHNHTIIASGMRNSTFLRQTILVLEEASRTRSPAATDAPFSDAEAPLETLSPAKSQNHTITSLWRLYPSLAACLGIQDSHEILDEEVRAQVAQARLELAIAQSSIAAREQQNEGTMPVRHQARYILIEVVRAIPNWTAYQVTAIELCDSECTVPIGLTQSHETQHRRS